MRQSAMMTARLYTHECEIIVHRGVRVSDGNGAAGSEDVLITDLVPAQLWANGKMHGGAYHRGGMLGVSATEYGSKTV